MTMETLGWMVDAPDVARRLLDAARLYRHTRGDTPQLPALFGEIGVDVRTLDLSELMTILVALDCELKDGDYPPQLVEEIRFSLPLALPRPLADCPACGSQIGIPLYDGEFQCDACSAPLVREVQIASSD